MNEQLTPITNPAIYKRVNEDLLFQDERKDNGLMKYTTISETIRAWADDPYGTKTLDFASWAYGIPREHIESVFDQAGMSEYLRAKQEGRFVSMVATQILKPTHYYLSNLLANAELSRMGIPTAVLIMDCPSDIFHKDNPDKGGAFGKIKFPVPYVPEEPIVLDHEDFKPRPKKEKKEEDKSLWKPSGVIEIDIQPYAIRHDDGRIQLITSVNEADGYRCDQILIQITDAKGPQNMRFSSELQGEGYRIKESHLEAALGISIPYVNNRKLIPTDGNYAVENAENSISLTDFYRILWTESITNMRNQGILPSEEEMPIIYTDAQQIYTTFAEHANPPEEVKAQLRFQSEEDVVSDVLGIEGDDRYADASTMLRDNNLQLKNGVLVHPNGMMDPASYYPVHVAIPDLYLECSSCGGPKFVGKLRRAQELREIANIPNKQVRLPDNFIAELEEYMVHPGSWVDVRRVTRPYDVELAEANYTFEHIRSQVGKGYTVEDKNRAYDEVHAVRQKGNKVIDDILYGRRNGYAIEKNTFLIPEPVNVMYRHMFTGVPEMVFSPRVQSVVQLLR